MKTIVIFGAGNIGRSFIGSIFSANKWSVIFIDANKELVGMLNKRNGYPVLIKRNDQADERIEITGVSALHSSDKTEVLRALAACDLCSTSVGQNALKFVVPQIADAIKLRKEKNLPPLDVVIAENIRNGAEYFRGILKENGLDGNEAGLVETSIGKMVPIMNQADLAEDPLILHAEEYNTLILDKNGFKNELPDCREIKAVNNIAAWVDLKLFIHNLGHAAAAYLGYQSYPEKKLIAEVISETEIAANVRRAMNESAAALLAEYPEEFTKHALDEHIDDLLFRFANNALGDTVFRVGRDLYRKLNRDDRIIGAAGLCLKHKLSCEAIIDVFFAALNFKASDEYGKILSNDEVFQNKLAADPDKLIRTELKLNKKTDEHLIKLLTKK